MTLPPPTASRASARISLPDRTACSISAGLCLATASCSRPGTWGPKEPSFRDRPHDIQLREGIVRHDKHLLRSELPEVHSRLCGTTRAGNDARRCDLEGVLLLLAVLQWAGEASLARSESQTSRAGRFRTRMAWTVRWTCMSKGPWESPRTPRGGRKDVDRLRHRSLGVRRRFSSIYSASRPSMFESPTGCPVRAVPDVS